MNHEKAIEIFREFRINDIVYNMRNNEYYYGIIIGYGYNHFREILLNIRWIEDNKEYLIHPNNIIKLG